VLLAADLAVIGIWPDKPTVVIVAVILAGAFLGVNNTLVTTAVMSIAPVERPVASATYGFERFIGGAWPRSQPPNSWSTTTPTCHS
jgi:ACDE family multidrug resistance protein